MSHLKLFKLEAAKNISEIKRRPVSFIFGIVFLFATYLAAQNFPWLSFLASKANNPTGIWIYFSWIFCLGTTLEICNGLCIDIGSGVISKISQASHGLRKILFARFLVSACSNIFAMAILILAFFFFGYSVYAPDAATVFLLFCLFIQSYAMMLVLAGATITQKNISAAYSIGIFTIFPLVLAPLKLLLGSFVFFIPISGVIEALKSGSGNVNFFGFAMLACTTFVFAFSAKFIFQMLLARLKKSGTLLFV